jgi:hypothetical protein
MVTGNKAVLKNNAAKVSVEAKYFRFCAPFIVGTYLRNKFYESPF